jgi:acetyl esterase/lipase
MTLHPQSVAALELWAEGPRVTDPGFGEADIEAKRAEDLRLAAAEPKEPVDRVEDVDADGVPCRLYVPRGATAPLVFMHGGGFVFGDVETHDAHSRRLANRTRRAVLAVDYRRPPEHRFPAAPEDVDTALRWLVRHAPDLGLDPGRVVTIGDSAGGNLALVAAMHNLDVVAACVLVYPFVDSSMSGASYAATDGGITRGEAEWYWQQYAARPEDLSDKALAPYLDEDLGAAPPTYVLVAEHDLLADEDRELARRIAADGQDVELVEHPGMIHGFWRRPELFDAAEESLSSISEWLDRTV